jgi:hypothetical protein
MVADINCHLTTMTKIDLIFIVVIIVSFILGIIELWIKDNAIKIEMPKKESRKYKWHTQKPNVIYQGYTPSANDCIYSQPYTPENLMKGMECNAHVIRYNYWRLYEVVEKKVKKRREVIVSQVLVYSDNSKSPFDDIEYQWMFVSGTRRIGKCPTMDEQERS